MHAVENQSKVEITRELTEAILNRIIASQKAIFLWELTSVNAKQARPKSASNATI